MRAKSRSRVATIRFNCFTYDPWPIVVAGSLPELGNWDPRSALMMECVAEIGRCREWTASIKRPAGESFEFKFVANTDSGPFWEAGDNRTYSSNDRWIAIADGFRG